MNTGVILGRRETDYLAGTLPYEVRNPSGDWRPYAPPGERQWNWKADSMSCVSFAMNNSLETQLKFLTGSQPNLSDRWLAVMSGTTMSGNYLYKVADILRWNGIVLESDYPTPPEPWSFDEFHKPIVDPLYTQLLNKAYAWKANNSVAYEWIDVTPESLRKHLKHAPIVLVIPGHCICGIYCEDDIVTYFDTYEPFTKTAGVSYLSDAMKLVLTTRNMSNAKLVKKGSEFGFYLPAVSEDALISLSENLGKPVPRKADGHVDWANINVEGTLV